jgi:hypothetical protein
MIGRGADWERVCWKNEEACGTKRQVTDEKRI